MVRRSAKKLAELQARPLALEDLFFITPERAALMRLLSVPQFSRWLEEMFQIDMRRSLTDESDEAMLIVTFRCPSGTLCLGFSMDVMPALSLAVMADVEAEVPFAILVAARLLAPFLDRFSKAAKQAGDRRWHAMGVTSIVSSAGYVGNMGDGAHRKGLAAWDVMLPNHIPTKVLLLSVDVGCINALQDMVDVLPVSHHSAMQAWTIQTTLRIATRSWTAFLLNSLEIGDVLLISEAVSVNALQGILFCGSIAGRHWTCAVRVNGEKIIMASQIETEDGNVNADPDPSATAIASNVAELEVPVHFEVDSAALSLAQLASLQVGYVINLSLPVEQAEIRLVACGQLIGRGKLVVIGDCLGVQISHIVTGRA